MTTPDLVTNDSVEVVEGDRLDTLPAHRPFVLLFADVEGSKSTHQELTGDLVAPGGFIVLDDLTPPDQWPAELKISGDPLRTRWLRDERFVTTIIQVEADHEVIIATRR